MNSASRRKFPTWLLALGLVAAACRRQPAPASAASSQASEGVALAARNPAPQAKDVTPRLSVPQVAEQLTDDVTNAHVVDKAQKVTISLVDGRKVAGKVLGRDPLTDVAVVRAVEGDKLGTLTTARLGNSDQLRVAQWVLAVGSPLGLDQSVTAG